MNLFRLLLIVCSTLPGPVAYSRTDVQYANGNEHPLLTYENFLGEGLPEYEAVQNTLELKATPDNSAAIAQRLPVKVGQRLTFTNVMTRSIEPGKTRLKEKISITAREFGKIQNLSIDAYHQPDLAWRQIMLSEKDHVLLMMWLSEGNCLLSVNRRIYESEECPSDKNNHWVLLNQPEVETWIQLSVKEDKSWVKVDNQQVQEVSRHF